MKKIIFILVMVMVAVFAVHSQTGVIRELTGDVELKPAGSSAFIPAVAGNQVAQNTIISTGIKSTAIIEVGSNLIVVRPLTRLSLSEIQSSAGSENLNINLQTGRVRLDVKPPAGTRANTTVQSPAATASVRGTSIDMDTGNVNVLNGAITWGSNNGIKVRVSGGNNNKLKFNGQPYFPVEMALSGYLPSKPVGSGGSGETLGSPGGDASGLFQGAEGSIDVEIGYVH